ncbi:hypothetical protein JST97_35620 [bacterium]|nr:hypothetical protein [bacterium]
MKRVYWLLIAAVPVVLWWLSQGGSQQETQQSPPSKPDPKPDPKPQPGPEGAPEPVKDLPAPTNGTFHKPAPSETVAPPEAVESSPAEAVQEATEVAPSDSPQVEVPEASVPEPQPEPVEAVPVQESEPVQVSEPAPVSEPVKEGETIQLFDSKDRALEARLVDITSSQAQVTCSESLPEKEKVRLVLPFGEEAITVNGQLLGQEQGVLRFKIMTMKAGQKKRFEDYLSQRIGL